MDKQSLKLGWIGTGVMGTPMFGHLLSAGFKGYVHSRTRSKAAGLTEKGAVWCDSPQQVAEASDIVFTMVGYPNDVKQVYFGENGILRSMYTGKTVVDMTTTSPQLAIEIYQAASQKGAFALDAPVSGGDIGARNGTLSIMAGGDHDVFENIKPLFELLGKKIIHTGGAGSGQHTKMANQITIASTMVGVCESLIYGFRAGLDMETMLKAIGGGAAACWTIDNLAPRITKGDFEPGFFVDHFIKDMGIALVEAERMGIVLPGLALAHQLYLSVKAKGYGKKGTQALMLALKDLSGIT
ncbi:MAG: NAD(P)-dependent oxidoreductase [Bacteroidales bacterium]|nr:NAD(P)-dependent oxidoreductase [Bacteroidales bacterium]